MRLPNKIQKSDYVVVPWGIKPNLNIPYDAPSWGAPAICINTPDDQITLMWEDGKYFHPSYSLFFDEVWILTGPSLSYEFDDTTFETNILCRDFPEGYTFAKKTGPAIYYQILRYDHRVDDFGDYHHTILECEIQDKDGRIPV